MAKPKNVHELFWYWLFEYPEPDPPMDLVASPQINHKTIVTTFLMNPQLTEYFAERLMKYNLYSIPKQDLLRRLKQLIKTFKVSKYDFWTLAQRRDQFDPLAKCIWEHYELRPEDLKWLEAIFQGRKNVEILCGKAEKNKKETKEDDIFSLLSKHAKQQTQTSNLKQRLDAYKQWIIDLLSTKTTSCLYEGCMNCPLRNNPFVPPDYIINDPTRDEVDILIIGMNPYKSEVEKGYPFAGDSGKELRKVLKEKFDKENIVITNSAMCFIPDNGDPDKQTLECCKPLLMEQIKRLKPKVIVPLGALATQNLLGQPVAITKIAGQMFELEID